MQHLVDTEEWVFPPRVQALLHSEDFVGFVPDTQGRVNRIRLAPAALAARFDELRTHSLAALAPVTISDLERTAVHSDLGTVNLSELLPEWPGRDLMHIVQAERAMMQPYMSEQVRGVRTSPITMSAQPSDSRAQSTLQHR